MRRSWWSSRFWNPPYTTLPYTRLATMATQEYSSQTNVERQGGGGGVGGSVNASECSLPNSLPTQTQPGASRAWYERTQQMGAALARRAVEKWSWSGARRERSIDASAHALRTYHDLFLFGETPLCLGIRASMRGGKLGRAWSLVEFFLAALSGTLHVYSTYHLRDVAGRDWVSQIQNVASVIFVLDYLLRIYCEPVQVLYVFSYWGLIDLLSTFPIIFLFKSDAAHGNLLHLLQFLRVIRIIPVFANMGIAGSTLYQKILLVAMTTLGSIFLSAGIMQWIESELISAESKAKCSSNGCLNFLDAFYYIIVTVATVGYGDMTPKTNLGKLFAMLIIIAALIYIPLQVSRINSLASLRPYGGSISFRNIFDSRYIILTGSISFQAVQECLAEFYSSSHNEDNFAYPLHVTILAPFQPSYELKNLLALYNGLVEFIEGSPVYQSDLDRVCAFKATAILILANKATHNTKAEDAIQVVRALAVHRVCGHTVRIIVEVLDPITQTSAVWDETQSGRIEIICPAKLHYQMLSRSCIVRGLYTFIGNLFTSKIRLRNDSEFAFLSEFFHSYENEVYPLILPTSYHGMTFEEAAVHIFMTFDTILFALDVPLQQKQKNHIVNKVLLYPKGHIIKPEDVGLVISRDNKTVFGISNQRNQIHTSANYFKEPVITTPKLHNKPSNVIEIKAPAERVIDRWRHPGFIGNPSYFEDLQMFPIDPDGAYNLETQLRSVIHESHLESNLNGEPNATMDASRRNMNVMPMDVFSSKPSKRCSKIQPDVELRSNDNEMASTSTTQGGKKSSHFVSLEKATEKLLTWPPIFNYGQPHPVVLERRAKEILEDMKQKTLAIAELARPHILLCCQGVWPSHLFYFIKGLRQPKSHQPPIVILFPLDPSAEQWGLVGIFKDVYLVKGSPTFELDLMRGGILQAEKVVIFAHLEAPVGSLTAHQVQDTRYQFQVKSTFPCKPLFCSQGLSTKPRCFIALRATFYGRKGHITHPSWVFDAIHVLQPQHSINC
ncbi:uncharacterized protein [Physcomitrium patens]|uniref:uncharacterized protein isoform X5 n=1 Tax=Physcomitrium patens TaxID=3218 RepID=UPI000D16E690|nr:uncharacterized protein LOC112289293 isoform X3 [Physcomitrium patens]|eukprot:XP_024390173.1 uncharacterized protein LOC112289293 isoform X3 [Physcomitrella patens]